MNVYEILNDGDVKHDKERAKENRNYNNCSYLNNMESHNNQLA